MLLTLTLLYIAFLLLYITAYTVAKRHLHDDAIASKENHDTQGIAEQDCLATMLIIAVHTEVAAFEKSLQHWHNIAKVLPGNVRVCFVTQQRQCHSSTQINALYQQICGDNHPTIELLFDVNRASTKASKLNYVVDHHAQQIDCIGVFDIDTKVSSAAILAALSKTPTESVIQIVPMSTNDHQSLLDTMVFHGRARRNLAIELGLAKLCYQYPLIRLSCGVRYFCGASFLIHKQTLLSLGKFPQTNDDIQLGYKYTVTNQPIYIPPHVAFAPVPSNKLGHYLKHRVRVTDAVYTRFQATEQPGQNSQPMRLFKIAMGTVTDLVVDMGVLLMLLLLLAGQLDYMLIVMLCSGLFYCYEGYLFSKVFAKQKLNKPLRNLLDGVGFGVLAVVEIIISLAGKFRRKDPKSLLEATPK